jgi:hypothetical protein
MSAEAIPPMTGLTPEQLRDEVRRYRLLSLSELLVIMACEEREEPVPPDVQRHYDLYVDLAEDAWRQVPRS